MSSAFRISCGACCARPHSATSRVAISRSAGQSVGESLYLILDRARLCSDLLAEREGTPQGTVRIGKWRVSGCVSSINRARASEVDPVPMCPIGRCPHATDCDARCRGSYSMWSELVTWFDTLEPTFVFLLALPFVVSVMGLLTYLRDRQSGTHRVSHRGTEPESRRRHGALF